MERSCPAALQLALRLWARIDPVQWRMEWYLPVWLGDAFELRRELMNQLAVSNVLGLAAIRLRDDHADGELGPTEVADAECLSAALYAAALSPYRRLFAGDPAFWRRLDAWMADWRTAVQDDRPRGGRDARSEGAALAHRGAPLKISALAACLLTGRDREFSAVERCLDHALAAMVLYDHACDWEDDLATGRWNAFVAECSARQPLPADRPASRADVLAGMMSGGKIGPYFARIRAELERARVSAAGLNVTPLAAFLGELQAEISTQAAALDVRYGALGESATALLFGTRSASAVAGINIAN